MNFSYIKTQIVELPVLANSTLQSFNFPTQNFLRQKQIMSIEIYSVHDMTLSPLGNVLPTTANLSTAYLTLYGENPEDPEAKGVWIENFPLWSLHRLNNGTDPFVFELPVFMPRNIVWEKSSIITGAVLGNTSNLSWVLNVGYQGNLGD